MKGGPLRYSLIPLFEDPAYATKIFADLDDILKGLEFTQLVTVFLTGVQRDMCSRAALVDLLVYGLIVPCTDGSLRYDLLRKCVDSSDHDIENLIL